MPVLWVNRTVPQKWCPPCASTSSSFFERNHWDAGTVCNLPKPAAATLAEIRSIIPKEVAFGTCGESGIIPTPVAEVVYCAQRPIFLASRTSGELPEDVHPNLNGDMIAKIESDGFYDRVFETAALGCQLVNLVELVGIPAL